MVLKITFLIFAVIIHQRYKPMETNTTQEATTQADVDYIVIRQPNTVTNARYRYSAMQKNIFYHIIDALQPGIEKTPNISTFGDLEINLPLSKLAGANKNYKLVLSSIKDLMTKRISYSYLKETEELEITTVLIYTMKHLKGSGFVTLKISSESVPVLLTVSNGFTLYNKKIALNLASVYSKRMYEFVSRWKDTGGFTMKIDEFKAMLGIEKKFKNNVIGGLRQKVLDVAKGELDVNADLSFNYTFKKAFGSRAFTNIVFKVYKTNRVYNEDEIGEKEISFRQYGQIYNYVSKFLPMAKIPEVPDMLRMSPEGMEVILDRFIRFSQDVESGKIMAHGKAAYFAKILNEEYGIPLELMPFKRKYKSRKRSIDGMPRLNFGTKQGG